MYLRNNDKRIRRIIAALQSEKYEMSNSLRSNVIDIELLRECIVSGRFSEGLTEEISSDL